MRYTKGLTPIAFGIFASLSFFCFADEPLKTTVITSEMQEAKTPAMVLERLKAGNQRFVDGKMKNRDLLAQANAASDSQHPVAVILNCMDARTPPELIFDQGIGDIFAARIAGNIENNDILGSMEFGTKVVGAKLIAVIGHTNCGAMRGACQQVKMGNLTALLEKIQPAVKEVVKDGAQANCDDAAVVDQIAKANVLQVMKNIKAHSKILNQMVEQGDLGIVGGIQDLATGKVTFFDDHQMMKK